MRTLRNGSQGPDVQLLQVGLARAGFSPGTPDGIFGGRPQRALEAFQAEQGLEADGIVGPLTWAALDPWLLGYTVHIVAPGDTFSSIARQYGTSVRAIDTANPSADTTNLMIGDRLVVPLGFSLVPTDISYSSDLMDYLARGLKARYPFLAVGSIGRSIIGRPLTMFSIGRGPTQVFYNASHHANEWITTPVLMKFLEEYAQAWADRGMIGGVSAGELYAGITLFLVPMVNPDGVDLVTGAIGTGVPEYEKARQFAENYPAIPFPEGWKANLLGVDLNLQYPAGWLKARDIKFSQGYTRPGPRDFVGRAPLNQREAIALARYTLGVDPALVIALHTQGKAIYWKFQENFVAGAQELGAEFARLSGYALEDTPYASSFAGYKDWFIKVWRRPGYTVECGSGQNPLPLSQFEEIYRAVLGILVTGATGLPC